MPELPYLTEEARANIGVEKVVVSDPASLRHIKEFAAAMDDWDPLYHDDEYAKTTHYGGVIAPPLFHQAMTRPVVPEDELQEDGQYQDIAVPGVYGRTLAGEGESEMFNPIYAGDVLTERTKVVDIQEKEGRSGRLIFVTSESAWTNQRGQLVARSRSNLIFH